MKKEIITIMLGALILLSFTGCETVRGLVYEERVTETTGTLAVDAVEVEPGIFYAVADLEPGTYSQQEIIPAGQPVTIRTVEMVPTRTAETGIGILAGLLGPYGGLAGVLATGALGIYSTVTNRRLSTARKAEISMVQAVDVFRDVLDRTPQGEKIDKQFTGILKERQQALGVHDHVRDLVRRWETPTKEPLNIF